MSESIKCACTSFYEQDTVKYLLGESFHPGGVDLTEKLGCTLGLDSSDTVLDVASGQGTSSVFIARTFCCSVTGVDLSRANIEISEKKAVDNNVSNVWFRCGDAEELPASDGEFSVVVSECAFCTFPDKETAAKEMYRVLKPGGRIGITDMTVDQEKLPEDMKTMLYHAACIADARTTGEYIDILAGAGFKNLKAHDYSYTLTEMLDSVRKRLLLAELAVGLKKLDLGEVDFKEVKKLLVEAEVLIKQGVIGYVMITGRKEE
ncbi:MAG: methyltransferase domain-containing protein [Firmicutes bacterium]|nr:methyltransferase domain-containing protein [Bacillota bacterium]